MTDPVWLRAAFELPLTSFTMLLLVFLVNQLLNKRSDFSSGFYVMFASLCANNILSLLLARPRTLTVWLLLVVSELRWRAIP